METYEVAMWFWPAVAVGFIAGVASTFLALVAWGKWCETREWTIDDRGQG